MKTNILTSVVIALTVMASANKADAATGNNFANPFQFMAMPTATQVIDNLDAETSYKCAAIYQDYLIKLEKTMRSGKLSLEEKKERVESLKEDYTYKFCEMLDSWQTEVVVNSIPFSYLMGRSAK